MKLRLFFLALCCVLIACKQDTGKMTKIEELEKAIADNPTPQAIQQLITTYQQQIADNAKNVKENAVLVGKISALHLKKNAVPEAITTLTEGIRSYYAAPATADNVWALITIYEDKLKRPSVTKALYKLYVEKFPKGANISQVRGFLETESTSIKQDIEALGGSMYNEQTHRLNNRVASDFIQVCDLYALLKPEDSLSPDYLHKAGETARAIRAFPQAIKMYNLISVLYPNYAKAPQALFLKAFTYDNDLKDYDKAKSLYEEFLRKYPNDDFADDTAFLLENLGKNDEEIIETFNSGSGEAKQ